MKLKDLTQWPKLYEAACNNVRAEGGSIVKHIHAPLTHCFRFAYTPEGECFWRALINYDLYKARAIYPELFDEPIKITMDDYGEPMRIKSVEMSEDGMAMTVTLDETIQPGNSVEITTESPYTQLSNDHQRAEANRLSKIIFRGKVRDLCK